MKLDIKSAQYEKIDGENSSITIVVDDERISVPFDPANRHYAAILEWAKDDGNEIAEAD